MEQHVDVVVIGDGVVGLAIAFAVADSPGMPRVALVARPGPAASRAAGAMLGLLGEITAGSSRTADSRARLDLATRAAGHWPRWRERVLARAGADAVHDGYGTGTFLLLNAASSQLDDESFTAVEEFAAKNALPAERVSPGDIPGHRPFAGDRAHRALYLPDEGYLDARRWLANLETALVAMDNVTIHRTDTPEPVAGTDGYTVLAGEDRITAAQAVVAAGVWTPDLVRALRPDVTVLPVVAGAGAALRLRTPVPLRAVVRTPNRAFACGLHAVPQVGGDVYLGATNNVSLTPGRHPTLSNLHHLADAAAGQLHEDLATAEVVRTHFGNRPIGLDTYPLLGPTSAPGLWVATGTYREGLHISPLVAGEIAAGLAGTEPGLPVAFRPERDPIVEWKTEDAVAEAARHCDAVAVENRMRPPVMGRWPAWLRELYGEAMERCYARLPAGFVLAPELAPLAYETPDELCATVTGYLDARTRSAL